jgi:dimethylaniline monooxygenase (N-oxide forming)
MPSLPTAAVIGAGSSGIAAAKALHERGIPFSCFEASNRVGGNWVFANKNGMSAAYRQLFINTSRDRMEYSDYPMPKSYPDFPHHRQIAAYFDAYVDHFGFRDRIRFEAKVARAERLTGGGWELTLDDGSVERLDALRAGAGRARRQGFRPPVAPGAARAQVAAPPPAFTAGTGSPGGGTPWA